MKMMQGARERKKRENPPKEEQKKMIKREVPGAEIAMESERKRKRKRRLHNPHFPEVTQEKNQRKTEKRRRIERRKKKRKEKGRRKERRRAEGKNLVQSQRRNPREKAKRLALLQRSVGSEKIVLEVIIKSEGLVQEVPISVVRDQERTGAAEIDTTTEKIGKRQRRRSLRPQSKLKMI